ncbi:hypothetical protein ACO0R3_000636 [Hanseniaspora guilliermondii]
MSTDIGLNLTDWNPESGVLQEIKTQLANSMNIHDSNLRLKSINNLDSLKNENLLEFINYLFFIFLTENNNLDVKSASGLYLKNAMLGIDSFEPSNGFIKNNLLIIFKNPTLYSHLDKNINGIIITTVYSTYFAKKGRMNNDFIGLQVLQELIQLIDASQDLYAMRTITKIMEDSCEYLDLKWMNDSICPLSIIIPKMISYLQDDNINVKIKIESLKCINCVIPLQTQSFLTHIDTVLGILFALASNSTDSLLREQLCIIFQSLLDFRADKLVGNLQGLVSFMLHLIESSRNATNNYEDEFAENAALEASDFLLSMTSSSCIPEHLIEPYIKDMIPVLIQNLIFDQEKIEFLESTNDEIDSNIPDKEEDIKPTVGVTSITKKKKKDDGTSSKVDASEDDEDDEDYYWTLRKSCANTLDCLTEMFPVIVTQQAFPLIKDHITNPTWYIREASILALGLLSEGMIKTVQDLDKLIPLLINELRDPVSCCREITCWTLRRFTEWMSVKHPALILQILNIVLNHTIFDIKKKVQNSAISAVADFIHYSDDEIFETLLSEEILIKLNHCLEVYQKKNLLYLYDTIQTYLEKRQSLDETELNIIMPTIMKRWNSLSDQDRELWPLLQCLSTMSVVLGHGFSSQGPKIYERCCNIINECFKQDLLYKANINSVATKDRVEKDFLCGCLDLIDGLVQGQGDLLEPLFLTNDDHYNILTILSTSLQDDVHEVRQSSYALLGDLLLMCYDSLQQHPHALQTFLQSMLLEMRQQKEYLDTEASINALGNAMWCLGVFVVNLDINDELIINFLQATLDLMNQNIDSQLINDNCCVVLGKICYKRSDLLLTIPQFKENAQSIMDKVLHIGKTVEDPEEQLSIAVGIACLLQISGGKLTLTQFSDFVEIISSEHIDIPQFKNEIYGVIMNHQDLVSQLDSKLISFINSL